MIIILVIGITYEFMNSSVNNKIAVNPFIVTALVGGLVVRMVTKTYLKKKKVNTI
jgi:hypothetical protein